MTGLSGVGERIGRDGRGWLMIVLALLVLNVLLTLPDRPSELNFGFFIRIAPELPLIVLALVLSPTWLKASLRWAITLLVAAIVFFSIADLVMRNALDRAFKPLLDLHLASAGWELLSGTVGTFRAVLLVVALVACLALMLAGLIWSVRIFSAIGDHGRRRTVGVAAVAVAAGIVAVGTAGVAPVRFDAAKLLARHGEQMARDIEVRRAFAVDSTVDRYADVPPTALLAELGARDVLIVFIESYGRSVIEDPRYSPTIDLALDDMDETLDRIGAGIRSAWLTSPVSGGQSWLAHGTFLSGLWIDSQRRYDALLTTNRRTLVHAFGDAGWRTLAVMPAITQAWPQGSFFAYDQVYAADDLGYAGDPFNWVTMPDQYTLSAFERLERAQTDRPPVMAEIALISSHAPWTPIAELVPWDEVGDGSVFNRWANSGDPPAVVWRDFDRVRSQYLLAVDYSVRTMTAFLETYLDDDTLVIILGDHQPAPLITGEDASRDVPLHIISRDAELLAALEDWQWTEAANPTADAPVWRMDEFRDRFLSAFTPNASGFAQIDPE